MRIIRGFGLVTNLIPTKMCIRDSFLNPLQHFTNILIFPRVQTHYLPHSPLIEIQIKIPHSFLQIEIHLIPNYAENGRDEIRD